MRSDFFSDAERRQARRLLRYVTLIAVLAGIVFLPDLDSVAAYSAVLLAGLAPIFIWLRLGAPGIPILPLVSCLYILYFGVPVLARNVGTKEPSDILTACLTVAMFLIVATLFWREILIRRARRSAARPLSGGLQLGSTKLLAPFILGSLSFGLLFQITVMLGFVGFIGPLYSIVRAVALSASSAGSFLAGSAIGSGDLTRSKRPPIYLVLAASITLQMTGLYLVQALTYLAALLFGYVVSARRIPWAGLVVLGLVFGLLNEGKGEMRDRYWHDTDQSTGVSVLGTPAFIAEWVGVSVDQLLTVNAQQAGAQSLLNRASLLTQLVDVQQSTPAVVPYLDGTTYALFPLLFIPRFLSPDKVNSQIAAHLMSVRYGYMTPEQTSYTTVDWGIVAEAFANFGYFGVAIAAILFGILAGWLSSLSIGTAPLSLSNLLGITGLVTMLNPEMDFGLLLLTMWQAMVAVFIFYYFWRSLAGKRAAKQLSPRPA